MRVAADRLPRQRPDHERDEEREQDHTRPELPGPLDRLLKQPLPLLEERGIGNAEVALLPAAQRQRRGREVLELGCKEMDVAEGRRIVYFKFRPVVPKFEYAKVLPKYFRGTIEKVEFDLGPAKLSAEDLQRIYLQRFASAVRN